MSTLKTNQILTVAGKPLLNSTGSILQVASAVFSFSQSTTSSTFQSSSLVCSITPSSSSNKVLITFSCYAYTEVANNHVAWSIFRDGVNLDTSGGILGMGNLYSSANTLEGQANAVWLDSPASTSTLSYRVYFKSYNNSSNVSFGGGRRSSIVLMEVSG